MKPVQWASAHIPPGAACYACRAHTSVLGPLAELRRSYCDVGYHRCAEGPATTATAVALDPGLACRLSITARTCLPSRYAWYDPSARYEL